MNILEINDLTYSYDGKGKALEHVSFAVEEGVYVALIGHNGSGKSTLAKLIMGLLESKEGEIRLFGEKLNKSNLGKLRSRVGIVFQNPDNQFVGSTVADDIAFGLENKNVPSEEMDAIINEYASRSGMVEFLDHEPSSLSGGQKQRVAIAGVLAMNPDLVILDEATAMLDPKGKKEIRDFITKIREHNPKLSILSITHDIEEASLADEVIVLNEGKLFVSGSPSNVFSLTNELNSIHLDVPFVYKVKAALKEKGVNVPDEITDLDKLEEWL